MDPNNSSHRDDDSGADAPREAQQTPVGSQENILEHHLADIDAEHALLMRLWNTPLPGSATAAPNGPENAPHHAASSQPEAAANHVTVLHQAHALTAGDLRAALIGIPDDQPVAIDVPLDPGGLILHRYVLTSAAATVVLLADEDEALDPSLVLRGDFPTGVYEIPTDDAPTSDPSPRTH